ncbi:bestrophin family protein [Synechococcus sp. PCC 7336]|uniref:bestrophin family protein n=1 Tax=Synechococcus sp. PCC 7336 TaxID=195250 RepID=UPI001D0D2815|nr:bestrophin family ion channel [Synechococcus sp. PCC 7336]
MFTIATNRFEKPDWLTTIFQLKGSVILIILPRILFFCGFTTAITLLYTLDFPIYFQKLGDLTTNVIYNLILGLLVVFRTNTSYDRFWEGRKAWGVLAIDIRNLAQEIRVGVAERDETDFLEKQSVMRLLSAFAIATKLHLRGEAVNDELKALLTPARAEQLEASSNRPFDIIFWIRCYLQKVLSKGEITESKVGAIDNMLNQLTGGVSGCERIITTPIPITYRVYLKRLILIYCIGLPFKTIPELTWWSLPIVAVVSFLLLGVEEVARELENPFGYNVNDLPLDDFCRTIASNVEHVLSLETQIELTPKKELQESLSGQLQLFSVSHM